MESGAEPWLPPGAKSQGTDPPRRVKAARHEGVASLGEKGSRCSHRRPLSRRRHQLAEQRTSSFGGSPLLSSQRPSSPANGWRRRIAPKCDTSEEPHRSLGAWPPKRWGHSRRFAAPRVEHRHRNPLHARPPTGRPDMQRATTTAPDATARAPARNPGRPPKGATQTPREADDKSASKGGTQVSAPRRGEGEDDKWKSMEKKRKD